MSDKDEALPSREELAVGALLASMSELGYDGKEVRRVMIKALGLTDAEDRLRSQHARIKELSASVTKANEQAERFEREWYLRGDRIEELEAELAEQCRINAMGAERELSALNRVRELEAVARVALEALELAEDLIASEWGEPDPLDKTILTIESLRKALGEA